jgi:cell division protein FtsI (penicillin-binding protein 3)
MIRIRILNVFLFLISLVYFSYLFYIQVIKHDHYEEKAKNQHEKKMVILGARGNIYDRNGLPLATSQQCFSVFCTPRYSVDKATLAREVAIISGKRETEVKKCIDKNEFFWVEKKIDLRKRDKYLEIGDPSIGFTHDLNRQYNMQEMFTSLIGKCGSDNRGIEGLELQLNDILSGTSGFAIYQKDPTGAVFPYHNYPESRPQPGQDVFLTIDLQLQAILFNSLKETLTKEDARYAAGLIIEPTTGEILALVNIGKESDIRNHVVCDEFEPGSTFKLLTLTYALMNGYGENDVIDTEGGTIKVRGHTIHDYKNYGSVTFKQAIAHSSNVAMVKISKTFDRQEFFLLIRDFGFGQLTGVEFPGEIKGKLPNVEKLNDIEFATLAFGQGLTVNLVQLAFAYQVIANGGVLNKPIVIREIREGDKSVYHAEPLRIRRAVDEEIAARATDILCGVVEEGSGVDAALHDVRVAAKTGTAQKVINGKYSNTSIITTFVGYFPAESPDYLIAIMFDEPKRGMWASTTAAPVFRNIAQTICKINSDHYAVK